MFRVYYTRQCSVVAFCFEHTSQFCKDIQHRRRYHALLNFSEAQLEYFHYLPVLCKHMVRLLIFVRNVPLNTLLRNAFDLNQLTQAFDLVLPTARLQLVNHVIV